MIFPCKIILFLPILLIIIFQNKTQGRTLLLNNNNNNNNYKKLPRPFNNTVSAVFVFGDSTVDSGNNNYINTIAKCDFPPYGRDFSNHVPTGRFTNGRLVTDYLAWYVGIKDFVPPYLDPSLSLDELMTGVSFASGSSGFDPLTAQLVGLMNEGARVIGVAGVPPFGCLPIVITIDSGDALQPRRCIESYSAVAREYNSLLQRLLKTMEIDGTKLFYVDIYSPINDMIQNPIKYGFSEVTMGCCGSGLIEASILCNPKSIVCNNPSNHMFWDAVHPSEATYYNVFKAIRPSIDFAINQL
ncbi:GDSL esterase/lipase At5g45960-like isoform X2 [Solanum lycopersicum]|uniref:GDSL esterase/lipase At5g45960-like isoform X2 n=1 Tax=Solanum lycopersicum TaxID=4081 RepID=UPI0008FEBEE2|nr:GDSL esterase/lipase At5g45960-like isoform X2 [Solanum lycopersicum]